jgi:hypothetical protein
MSKPLAAVWIVLACFVAAWVALVGAILFGTGIGFLIRGIAGSRELTYIGVSIPLFALAWGLRRLAGGRPGTDLARYRTAGWAVGHVTFVVVFIYYALKVSGES